MLASMPCTVWGENLRRTPHVWAEVSEAAGPLLQMLPDMAAAVRLCMEEAPAASRSSSDAIGALFAINQSWCFCATGRPSPPQNSWRSGAMQVRGGEAGGPMS